MLNTVLTCNDLYRLNGIRCFKQGWAFNSSSWLFKSKHSSCTKLHSGYQRHLLDWGLLPNLLCLLLLLLLSPMQLQQLRHLQHKPIIRRQCSLKAVLRNKLTVFLILYKVLSVCQAA